MTARSRAKAARYRAQDRLAALRLRQLAIAERLQHDGTGPEATR